MNPAIFYAIGIILVAVGAIVILTVIVFASISTKKSKTHDAGIIIIGPIPIIFGTDKKSVKSMLAFALSLTVFVLIIAIVHYLLLR